jgi:hypothetical protein
VAAGAASGPSVDFIVVVNGDWDDAVDAITPRVIDLKASRPFNYHVAEWGSDDTAPTGYLTLIDR